MTSHLRFPALAIAALLAAIALPLRAQDAPPKPNIVFIIADDLGWADVAFHGGRAPTPNLDRLRSQGLELTQHYSYPVCSPTRAALLSGRYATRFGVTNPQNERAYPWETVTLPRALKSAGYDTALMGKWHLGSKPEWGPQKYGFDHSYGSLAGGIGPWDHRYKRGPYSVTWHRNGKLLEEQGHVTDLLAAEAIRWLEGRGNRPYFLYVPFTAVHLPIREPEQYLSRVPKEITDPALRQYAACIIHLDDAVGRILAALDRTAKADNTLVVFTSDNGGSTARNETQDYPPDNYAPGPLGGDNRPLRDEKGSVYEGGIRVPTLVRWPARLKPGTVATAVQVTDWMPTFCGLAGYRPERDLRWDGQDLWPLLSGKGSLKPRVIYTAGPGFRAQALRSGDWKLVVHLAAPAREGQPARPERVELYNLATDPGEKSDLAASMPERVAALRAQLTEVARADRDSVATD